jgi:hypothetical protein
MITESSHLAPLVWRTRVAVEDDSALAAERQGTLTAALAEDHSRSRSKATSAT